MRPKTAFIQRCDDAWRDHRGLALRFSLHLVRRRHEIEGRQTNVYAVADLTADRIKFGHSEKPRERLGTIAVGNPNELELVCFAPAPLGLEKVIHGFLKDSRIAGEWFRPDPQALVVCELLLSAMDYQKSYADDEQRFIGDDTLDVLCQEAEALLDHLEAAA